MPESMTPKVSVVICTQNRLPDLKNCLSSLRKLDYPTYEILVVNDASTDDTKDYLATQEGVRAINNQTSKGLAAARNVGIDAARGGIIAFSDDDCLFDKDWLKEIVRHYKNPLVGCVGGISHVRKTKEIYYGDWKPWGCNVSFRADLLKALRFDPFFCYQHEETEVIFRMEMEGYKTIVEPKAIVYHMIADSPHRTDQRKQLSTDYLQIKRLAYLRGKDNPLWKFPLIELKLYLKSLLRFEIPTRISVFFDLYRIRRFKKKNNDGFYGKKS